MSLMSRMKSPFLSKETLRLAMKLIKYKNFVFSFQINQQELLLSELMELLSIGNHSIYTRLLLLVVGFLLGKNIGLIV